MAKAVEETLGSLVSGCVVTRYGHAEKLRRIKVLEAGHPIPDKNGLSGAYEILRLAGGAGKDDLIMFLLTGGASALLPAPVRGVTLADERKISGLLLNSGASIHEINAVRKHLSEIKGGLLLKRACPARVLTLIVSDVVGNDLSAIGSGPTAPDPATFEDCLKILKKYKNSGVPESITQRLKRGAKGLEEETPKPGGVAFGSCDNIIIADNLSALTASRKLASSMGFNTVILSTTVTGDTREAANFYVSVLKEIQRSGNPAKPSACVLMGGETTLKVTGRGLGGRNQEFALACALSLEGTEGITILSAGTDGTDGPTTAAGAFADSETTSRAAAAGLDPVKYLSNNDSHNFFKQLGGLFVTGPTGTNVMDIVIGIVD